MNRKQIIVLSAVVLIGGVSLGTALWYLFKAFVLE